MKGDTEALRALADSGVPLDTPVPVPVRQRLPTSRFAWNRGAEERKNREWVRNSYPTVLSTLDLFDSFTCRCRANLQVLLRWRSQFS